jgi:hypothetical protein
VDYTGHLQCSAGRGEDRGSEWTGEGESERKRGDSGEKRERERGKERREGTVREAGEGRRYSP